MVERTKIERKDDGVIRFLDDDGTTWTGLEENTPVSMNFWGFTPDYFAHSDEFFKDFLSLESTKTNLKAEFFIPLMVDKLIREQKATVKVLDTTSKWFGVTYPEDRPDTVAKIAKLIEEGVYPEKLF